MPEIYDLTVDDILSDIDLSMVPINVKSPKVKRVLGVRVDGRYYESSSDDYAFAFKKYYVNSGTSLLYDENETDYVMPESEDKALSENRNCLSDSGILLPELEPSEIKKIKRKGRKKKSEDIEMIKNRAFIEKSIEGFDKKHKSTDMLLQEAAEKTINNDGYYDYIEPSDAGLYEKKGKSKKEIALIAGLGLFCITCLVIMVKIITNFQF